MNDILRPSNSEIYLEKNLDTTKPRSSEHNLPVLWSFVNQVSTVVKQSSRGKNFDVRTGLKYSSANWYLT